MDFDDFIEAAKEYSRLGWSTQNQLDSWVDGERLPSPHLNKNAVIDIKDFLRMLRDEYGFDVDDYLDDEEYI